MTDGRSLQDLKVLVLSLDTITGDPRPTRLVNFLRQQGALVTLQEKSGVKYSSSWSSKLRSRSAAIWRRVLLVCQLVILPIDRRFVLFGWLSGAAQVVRRVKQDIACFDLIVLESYQLLPLVVGRGGDRRVVADLREFYPAQHEDQFTFRILRRPVINKLLSIYLPRCCSLLTVSDSVATAYLESFGVRTCVIESRSDLAPKSVVRPRDSIVRMVHHGVANRNRRLDTLIDLKRELGPEFELHLYLVGNDKYQRWLQDYASSLTGVYFHQPVEFENIPSVMASYDVGLCYFYPTTRNLLWCLPNKFFEYVCAGVPIVSGPSPSMARYIKQYGLGSTSAAFSSSSLADAVRQLVPDIEATSKRCREAAQLLTFSSQIQELCVALGVTDTGNFRANIS